MTVRSVGTSGTVVGNLIVFVGTATFGSSAQTATVTVNTTVAENLDLTLVGGGTSPSITVADAVIELVMP